MEYLEPGREVLGFQNPSPSGHGLQPRSAEALVLPAKRRSPDYLLPFRHDPLRHPLPARLASGCEEGRFVLDDGSDVIELGMCSESGSQEWKTGMYVMVVGHFVAAPAQSGGLPLIKVHKIVDLSGYPDREAMWHFEVIEAYKLFYVPSVE
ncbi:uncharacterized protein LOC103710189 isoform X2 [Phoenix dactylifera]|uniref:Uncharacterized protein LOC103710189 isoform X2 n=1 Tax=Phoenix dactylifera TaxID=42345 RepID=A0A8B8J6A0_PHODC|nr:uncharacterized protein LOC103710189 isoform X2 [Phoenix dactylifera]